LLTYLDVPDFAVIGVVLGFATLISMAVDLRLMDLVARRFVAALPLVTAALAVARAEWVRP